jgi:hypothetical protein
MSGLYFASEYEGEYYHSVVVDNCCVGLDFIWNGEHAYPGDFPEINARVEVAGVFGRHEKTGWTYYCLAVDEITLLHVE